MLSRSTRKLRGDFELEVNGLEVVQIQWFGD